MFDIYKRPSIPIFDLWTGLKWANRSRFIVHVNLCGDELFSRMYSDGCYKKWHHYQLQTDSQKNDEEGKKMKENKGNLDFIIILRNFTLKIKRANSIQNIKR